MITKEIKESKNLNINNDNIEVDNKKSKEDSIIKKHEYYTTLFDFYENLFTDKQRNYFSDFYFYDLSLSEIAKNYNISRSAVFDAIDKIHKQLDDYEKKLSLFKKFTDRDNIYNEYLLKNNINKDTLNELINKLKEIE